MELVKVNKIQESEKHNSSISSARGFYTNNENAIEIESSINSDSQQIEDKPFIVANTKKTELENLKNDCVIPVFSKCNSKTLAHQEFIEIIQNCVARLFPRHQVNSPEIRVSHEIKGRVPEAIHKDTKDLLDKDVTRYWQRLAFIIKIPGITETVNGNTLSLTFGGVRNYHLGNLYSSKKMESFKAFCGFQNQICMNLNVWSDGFVDDLRASSYQELETQIFKLIQRYKAKEHLDLIKDLPNYNLTETQFAQLIGKSRLYNYLPKKEKAKLPALLINDGQISTIAKDYYKDESFCRNADGDINLWNVFNLFTSANKSSYIDTFLDRNANAFDFTKGLQDSLNGDSSHSWFLS